MAKGTLVIDVRFPTIGRIQQRSGTTDENVRDGIIAILRKLYATGKHTILEQVRDGITKPLELYSLDLENKLDTAITTTGMKGLNELEKYVEDGEFRDSTKRGYKSCVKIFLDKYPNKKIDDMASCLQSYRDHCIKKNVNHRTFNQTRAICQSYCHNTPGFGIYSPLWTAVTNVKKITTHSKDVVAMTVAEVMELESRLDLQLYKDILWTLCLTGMRKGEYIGKLWVSEANRIVVNGVKTDNAARMIPKLVNPVDPQRAFQQFERTVREVRKELPAHPHAFRHTFRTWLQWAGVDSTRSDFYAGHAIAGISANSKMRSLYTKQDVEPHLKSDAEQFKKWLEAEKQTVKTKSVADKFFD